MTDTVTAIQTEAVAPVVDAAAVTAAPTNTDASTSPVIFSAEKVASGGTLNTEVKTETEITVSPETKTLLGADIKPVEAPVAPVAPVVETPKVTPTEQVAQTPPVEVVVTENKTEGQSVEPAPPPTYEAFVMPENVTLDQERVTEFTKLLAELETEGKTEHVLVQKFGQKAVDFHINEIQKVVTDLQKHQTDTWDRQKSEWKETFLKDPNLGGDNSQATIDSAMTFLRTHGGSQEQQQEFRSLMETSGLGNHPAMIRLLANAGRAMREGQPLAAQRPANTSVKSKTATLYGSL